MVFNPDTLWALDNTVEFDKIVVEMVISDKEGVDNRYIFFDDLRVVPIDAQMTTYTYDNLAGLVISESNFNNIPVKYEYDGLQRLIAARNYKGELLETNEYNSVRADAIKRILAIDEFSSEDTDDIIYEF